MLGVGQDQFVCGERGVGAAVVQNQFVLSKIITLFSLFFLLHRYSEDIPQFCGCIFPVYCVLCYGILCTNIEPGECTTPST